MFLLQIVIDKLIYTMDRGNLADRMYSYERNSASEKLVSGKFVIQSLPE